MNFQGAVFDADGTLLDSMHVWRNLGSLYLSRRGIQPEENLSAKLWPLSYEQGCEYIRTHYALPETLTEIQHGITELIEDFYRHEVTLKPGVYEFVQMLKREGVHMVIATSGDRELLTAALNRNNIAGYFDAVFTCPELHTDKHHAEIYMTCSEFLGLAPEHTAVFEDALFAIETAKSAGFITIGVEDEASANDKARIISTADYYISDWRNINEDSFNYSRK